MKNLEDFLTDQGDHSIQTLARYIHQYVAAHWQLVLEESQEELLHIFDKAGEGAAYGTYAQRLLRPVQKEIRQAGFLSEPSFPGTLTTSQEWGPQEARERWMWCVVGRASQETPEKLEPVGTLITRFFHDHTRLHIPHAPEISAITETQNSAIVAALSRTRGGS